MKTDVIVALDLPSSAHIAALLANMPGDFHFFKVGLELFTAEGPAALAALKASNKAIFLDLKLHDIPRTVARAVTSAAGLGVHLLTVHACGGRAMLKDAAKAARDAGPGAPKLVAVTALTSLDEHDMRDLGITRTPGEHVLRMAELALSCGIDGLVSSPQEVRLLREKFGPTPILVTPGIRLPSGEKGDQKRVGTPAQAARDGSSFLVVGRPIVEAVHPREAAQAILDDLARA
jgi:orotidine-5'-phosphate decarboxylase